MLSGIPLCQNISSILVLEHEVNNNTVINEKYKRQEILKFKVDSHSIIGPFE